MSITVNTNISSIVSQKSLYKATSSLNAALERMSTGLKINSSKDDAAGYAITSTMNYELSSYQVAQSNVQMGQSLVDTANGSLKTINKLLTRMRDLAEQSANGAYGAEERASMQTEMEGLQTELYRIKNTTEFNGKQIFGTEEVTRVTEAEAVEQGYTVVKTAQELKAALQPGDASCKVMLFADINLDDLGVDETGSNWTAVGTSSDSFKGTFDGNGFTISNLKINKPSSDNQGLFGHITDATITNVYMKNVHVTANQNVGGLVGYSYSSETSNCNVSVAVTGNGSRIGGLIGDNYYGSTVDNCCSIATVVGRANYTGGLVGLNYINSTVSNSSSASNVTGLHGAGGLVGDNTNAIIINSFSNSNVSGRDVVGGLVGFHYTGALIKNCSTTSIVSGTLPTTYVGAFVGNLSASNLQDNEYNSDVNPGKKIIGSGLNNLTETQIRDNTELILDITITDDSDSDVILNTGVIEFNLQVGINDDEHSSISVDTGFELGSFAINISTEKGARAAIDKIDKLISKIYTKQTELGAVSNRLSSAIEFQNTQIKSTSAAMSLIQDADMAEESSKYIKSKILQDTTSSLLSTANQSPEIALKLLQKPKPKKKDKNTNNVVKMK